MSAEWADEAIVLSLKAFGEHGAVASLFTRTHGRHLGLVHGARSKANRGILQPGNRVRAWWRARLPEQLGTLKCELEKAYAAPLLADGGRLAALSSAVALCEATLPERQPHPAAWQALEALLEALGSEAWASVYVHWELALLRDLGFGLDLSSCAATGATTDLTYVSPRSGRAVCRAAGEDWKDRLLPLPAFLVDGGEGDAQAVLEGLALAGHFLERHVLGPHRRPMPVARTRLIDRFRA